MAVVAQSVTMRAGARRVLRSQDEAQLMMNSPFSARQSVAEISLR